MEKTESSWPNFKFGGELCYEIWTEKRERWDSLQGQAWIPSSAETSQKSLQPQKPRTGGNVVSGTRHVGAGPTDMEAAAPSNVPSQPHTVTPERPGTFSTLLKSDKPDR